MIAKLGIMLNLPYDQIWPLKTYISVKTCFALDLTPDACHAWYIVAPGGCLTVGWVEHGQKNMASRSRLKWNFKVLQCNCFRYMTLPPMLNLMKTGWQCNYAVFILSNSRKFHSVISIYRPDFLEAYVTTSPPPSFLHHSPMVHLVITDQSCI